MRLAAAINNEDENFFWHFGHCERFKIYDINNGNVERTAYLTVHGGHGPQRLEAMIRNGVNIILTDGMGPGMAQAAPQYGIQAITGIKGNCDEAVKKYLNGTLENNPDAVQCCGQD